jgi:tetratricopeptide (TPR) repeat protein
MVTKFDIYSKLAKHARDDRDFDLAIGFLEKALVEKQDDYETAMELVTTRLEGKNPPHISVVMKDVERAFLCDPTRIEPYKLILPILFHNKLSEFSTWIERALVAFPDEVIFLNFAGVRAMDTDTTLARSYFSKCVALDPMNSEHHYNCGLTYMQKLDFLQDTSDKSIWHFQMALCWKPEWVEAKRALVDAYVKHSKFKEALMILSDGDLMIECLQIEAKWRSCSGPVDYDKLITKVSNETGVLGSVLKNQCGYFEAMCQYDKAEKAYRHVYEFREQYFGKDTFMNYDAGLGLGQFLCKIGKWDEGIPIMAPSLMKTKKENIWDGEPVEHLVIHNNTLGYGDHMFFARYVPLAAARARKTTLIVFPQLKHFFAGLSNVCNVTTDTSIVGDAWIDCSHLINFFGTVPMYDFVPSSAPATPSGKAILHLITSNNPLLQYRREIPFDAAKNILDESKYKWFSVCKQNGTHPNLTDLSDTLDKGPDAFKDTMKFMCEVDLVVTSDTSIAHVAGLMKRPCILLLTTLSEFRWGTEDAHFDWYPTVKCVYQKEWGKWTPLSLEDIEPR